MGACGDKSFTSEIFFSVCYGLTACPPWLRMSSTFRSLLAWGEPVLIFVCLGVFDCGKADCFFGVILGDGLAFGKAD